MFSREWKKWILAMTALCTMALLVAGCGDKESLTEKTFKSITEKTGVHMEVEQLDSGSRTIIGVAKKGDHLYASVEAGGQKAIILSDGRTITTLDPASKTMVKEEINEAYQKQLDQIASGTDAIMAAGESVSGDYEEGSVKYDGEEYATETFRDGEDEAVFGYKDGKLGYFALTRGGQKQVLKINALDGEVDEALFLIPEGYTAAGREAAPSNTREAASYKSIDAVGASVGSAGTGTPSGNYVEVNNDRGGYSFQMDKAFQSEIQEAHSYVYIEKGKKVPHFDVEPISFGGDLDQYFDTLIENLLKSQEKEMSVRPVRTQISVKGMKVKGIEYILKTGNSEMVCMFYVYPAGENYYKFAGFYIKDDMTTPYALQYAMETFRTV